MNLFTEPYFQDANKARLKIESVRWPNGPVCPHCSDNVRRYPTKREGRWRCGNPECRKDYTVTTGTVMESSHIPLRKWLMAFYLLASSKKGMSTHQLMRALGVTYKSAWFLTMRVRKAMSAGGLSASAPLGGAGNIVEADETDYGKREIPMPSPSRRGTPYIHKGKSAEKRPIVSLVERGGSVRSFHIAVRTRRPSTRS